MRISPTVDRACIAKSIPMVVDYKPLSEYQKSDLNKYHKSYINFVGIPDYWLSYLPYSVKVSRKTIDNRIYLN